MNGSVETTLRSDLNADFVESLYHDFSDALLIVDTSNARILDANRTAQRLFGRDQYFGNSQIVNQLSFKRSQEREQFLEALSGLKSFHLRDGAGVCSHLGNTIIPVELTLRPLSDRSRSLLQLRDSRPRSELEERA